MQIKVLSVPVSGDEGMNEELNRFLRGHKVLQVEQHLVTDASGGYWTFCIRYVDEQGKTFADRKERVDYRTLLSAEEFAKFSKLRIIRKAISDEEAIPAFAVFTDEELAGIAQLAELSTKTIRRVKGIGEKKCEKYAERFIKVIERK